MWSKHILWGNHMVAGGAVLPDANAWRPGVTWGAMVSDLGDNIVWGSACRAVCDNIGWGSAGDADNIVWGSLSRDNIVWGSAFLDADDIVEGTDGDGDDSESV